jgi:uncharacterized protein (DUF1330 family)
MPVEALHIDDLRSLPDDVPVTMLNLVRFRERSADGDGSGWDAYQRYSAACAPMIKSRGGTVLWAGSAETVALGTPEEARWDFAALVFYPSRAAFLDMMTSADYATVANPHRVNGVSEHVILATTTTYSKFKEPTRGVQ